MAGAIAKLYATLGLDTRGFDTGLTQSQGKLKGFVGGFKRDAMAGFGLGAGFTAFSMASSAVSTVVDVLGQAVTAAMEEEAAIAQLTRSIEENDRAWDGNIDAVEEVIRVRQKLAFADDEQRESLRRLVSVTGDTEKALELQRTAMDLARLRGMDLATAGDLIGKVYAGNLGTLSRYGIVLEKGMTATEALAEIQRRAAGQAEAYADTTAGKLTAAQLALDDAMEDLGASLLPVVAQFATMASDIIPKVAAAVGDLAGTVQDAQEAFVGLRDTVSDTVGRDIENDLANMTRIGMTGGIALFTDILGEQGFAFEDFERNILGVKDSYDVLSSAAGLTGKSLSEISDITVAPPDIAGPIEDEMAAARKAILAGFGNIKDALKDPPQLISRSDRVANMETRQGKINKQLNRAVAADDPFNIRYWASAAAKQQVQLDNLKSGTGTKLRDIKGKYSDAGIDIGRIWGRTGNVIERESRAAADTAIAEMQRTKSGIDAIDLTSSGYGLMAELAAGIRSGIAEVSAAASLAATAANPRASVVPPAASAGSGGGSGGGGGRTTYVMGNVYGGQAGLRQLKSEMDKADRLGSRGPMRYQQTD